MIHFVQINNKWATSTLILLFIKMLKFLKTHSFKAKTFVKENKKPLEIFRNISFFIRKFQNY
jgi:hypothetical protein